MSFERPLNFCSQACLCVGLQRLLSSWVRESSRYFEAQGRTAGESKPSSTLFRRNRSSLKQFAGPNESSMGAAIAAGPSNSVVIDKQGMYWMAGKVIAFSLS